MKREYQRRSGFVERFDAKSGRVHVVLSDEDQCVSLSSTSFVGGSFRRTPDQGDRVIVSFSNDTPVSGRLVEMRSRVAPNEERL